MSDEAAAAPILIEPTIGRVVWYQTNEADSGLHSDQPLAALVTYVTDARTINLVVFDHEGRPNSRIGVMLVHEGDFPPVGPFAEWMPYQKGQAKKNA